MHSPVPIRWTSACKFGLHGVTFLSRRMLPRSGGIYMALEIEQKQGGVLESPSFPGLPHRTNGEREDPKEVGEGFVSTMPQILLLRNPSRVLTPVKTVVKIILESGLQLLFRVSGISLDVFVERG